MIRPPPHGQITWSETFPLSPKNKTSQIRRVRSVQRPHRFVPCETVCAFRTKCRVMTNIVKSIEKTRTNELHATIINEQKMDRANEITQTCKKINREKDRREFAVTRLRTDQTNTSIPMYSGRSWAIVFIEIFISTISAGGRI